MTAINGLERHVTTMDAQLADLEGRRDFFQQLLTVVPPFPDGT